MHCYHTSLDTTSRVHKTQCGQTLVEYLVVMAALVVVYLTTNFMIEQLGAFNASQSESLRAIY